MFIRRKRISNFTDRVHRIYDKKFSFIEGVLNSCVTLDQIDYAARWASNVMSQYRAHEKKRLSSLFDVFVYIELCDVVNEYFDLKQNIIGTIFDRKLKEIEKQEVTEEDEND